MQDEQMINVMYNSYQYLPPSDRPRPNKRPKNVTNEEMYHSTPNSLSSHSLSLTHHLNSHPPSNTENPSGHFSSQPILADTFGGSEGGTMMSPSSSPIVSSSSSSPNTRAYGEVPPFTTFEKTVLSFPAPVSLPVSPPTIPLTLSLNPSTPPHKPLSVPKNEDIREPSPLPFPNHMDQQRGGSQNNNSNNTKLYELGVLHNTITQKLEELRVHQKTMSVPPPLELAERLDAEYRGGLSALEGALQNLTASVSNETIQPQQLYKLTLFKQELTLQLLHFKLLHAELLYLRNMAPARCFATLVITKQPFPKTLKQGTKSSNHVEDPITIRLLKGTRTEVVPLAKAKALLSYDDHHPKKHTLEIQNDTQDLDEHGSATFFNLRFPSGTRMKPVRLQFAVPVKYQVYEENGGQQVGQNRENQTSSGTGALVESDASQPFIVLTNENQWDVAAGVLLKKELFQLKEVTWHYFANVLQVHYLRATRQDLSRPERPLSKDDLAYFSREKFYGKTVIREKDFNLFWDWFGKVLYKIRHQKHFCSLWVQGYVWGFVSKADAESLLANEAPGTFLLRFSERVSGKVAVAYVKKDSGRVQNEIKHYLIDSHNEEKQSSTLPEFLGPHAHFLYFLQLNTCYDPPKNLLVKNRILKSEVLRNYFNSKDDPSFTVAGYDKEL